MGFPMDALFHVKDGLFGKIVRFRPPVGEELKNQGLLSKYAYNKYDGFVDISIKSNQVNESLIPQSFIEKIDRYKNLPFLQKAAREISENFCSSPKSSSGVGFIVVDNSIYYCNHVINACGTAFWAGRNPGSARCDGSLNFSVYGMESIKNYESLYCCSIAVLDLLFDIHGLPSHIINVNSIQPGCQFEEFAMEIDFESNIKDTPRELTKW